MTHPIVNCLRTEWAYLGKRRRHFILYMAMFFVAGAVSLLTPYVIGVIFNTIQQSITSTLELNALLWRIGLLLLITVAFWAFHGVARVMETNTGYFVKKNYINDRIRVVMRLPVKWHKDTHSGDTIDKINRAAGALEDFSCQMTYQLVYGFMNFFGSLTVMFLLNWMIGIAIAVCSLVVILSHDEGGQEPEQEVYGAQQVQQRALRRGIRLHRQHHNGDNAAARKTVSEEIDKKQYASYPTYRSSTKTNELKWGFMSVAIQAMIVACSYTRPTQCTTSPASYS